MSSLGETIAGPLSPAETGDGRPGDDLRRTAGSGVIALTGFGLLVPTVTHLLDGPESLVAGLLAGLGTAVALVLVAAGYLIHRAGFSATNTLRIAGWNTLGVVVLGLVLALVYLYRPLAVPPFVVATVLGVSAAAHVIIGVNDVRRIRAEELATEREKTAVLNRLIRHNLRNDVQVLGGFAERLTTEVADPELADVAGRVERKADDLGGMYEKVADIQQTIEGEAAATRSVELGPVADEVVGEFREEYPAAGIGVSIPAGLSVRANEQLRRVLANLVENAADHHGGEAPSVRLAAERSGDRVEIRVADDGPGIPDDEVAVLTGDRDLTQLDHGSGFGLWLVKWVVDGYGGDLRFEESDSGGTVVAVTLDAA
ncbi:HAMP domain-containing histidine kinase [Halorussus gelatinilyticus]|uniref:histidine kinase n=1 Tax=Halorussus gelatinilyticus TaxID=2937524 RepID=A0A8U0IN40_9EURY|nr:HAMP domain-containing sensor histidine kinase [Halorussus gelatinilyticus]UPW02045.1 HAMP domain-containing histidine kinase [Halorussus gelatinilyticus]